MISYHVKVILKLNKIVLIKLMEIVAVLGLNIIFNQLLDD